MLKKPAQRGNTGLRRECRRIASPHTIIWIIVMGHGRIAMINQVAERLLGIPTDRALGRLYREVVEEEHYEAVRGILREAGEAARVQYRIYLSERRIESLEGLSPIGEAPTTGGSPGSRMPSVSSSNQK